MSATSSDGLLALDARVVLHPAELAEEKLPRPAIRPYPSHYVQEWPMKSGGSVTIRPIRPEDEPMMVRFHETLSDRSVHFRYFHLMNLSQRVEHERLARNCFIDYDREMVLVAERKESGGAGEIIAVGRLMKHHREDEAEFAVIVSDRHQGEGLGTELTRRLVGIARDEKIGRVTRQQVRQIVETKRKDLNAYETEAAMKMIEGTARSMGLEVIE